MNTFKTAVVLATLLGVGYGVHIVLNRPLNNTYQQQTAQAPVDEFGLPRLDIGGVMNDGTASSPFQPPQILTPGGADNYQNGSLNSPQNTIGNITGNTINPVTGSPTDGQTQRQLEVGSTHHAMPELDLDVADFSELPSIPSEIVSQLPSVASANAPSAAVGQLGSMPSVPQYPNTNLPNPSAGGFADLAPPTNGIANRTSPGAPLGGAGQFPPTQPQLNQTTVAQTTVAQTTASAAGGGHPAAVTAANSAFTNIWNSAQAKIQSGQYADALFTLSLWYSNPNLTSGQRDVLIPLLDELAGRVIYSREHHFGPPHAVQSGETLAQIAAKHAVTPQFLARVNGLDSTTVLTQGQPLKIVTGPFRGELSLGNREVTIFVGSYYAGRFSAGVGRDLPLGEMALEITQKSGARPYVDRETNQQTVAGDPSNPYGNYWIGLRSPGATVDPYLGLHSVGDRVEASDTRGCVSLSERDADDLQTILSIGSRFTVHR